MLGKNIENLARELFNFENKEHHIPDYIDFIETFSNHFNINKKEFEAQAVAELVYFKIGSGYF